jgi:hypothetical protein
MKFKIYQPVFEESQWTQADPEFTTIDNTKNPYPELREYYIHLLAKEQAEKDNLDLWGTMSLRWKEKLPGYTAKEIINRIEANPGYDVYFFNGFIDQVLQSYNVWEQGLWHHPSLIKIMEDALPTIGVDPAVVYQPMGRTTAFFACYCVATPEFWNGYLGLVTNFLDSVPNYAEETQGLLFSPSQYPRSPDLWYFPFIQERLFSTYLTMNADRYRVLPYHHNEEKYLSQYGYLLDLKDQAIKTGSKDLLEQWRQERGRICNWPDHCQAWIQHFKGQNK